VSELAHRRRAERLRTSVRGHWLTAAHSDQLCCNGAPPPPGRGARSLCSPLVRIGRRERSCLPSVTASSKSSGTDRLPALTSAGSSVLRPANAHSKAQRTDSQEPAGHWRFDHRACPTRWVFENSNLRGRLGGSSSPLRVGDAPRFWPQARCAVSPPGAVSSVEMSLTSS